MKSTRHTPRHPHQAAWPAWVTQDVVIASDLGWRLGQREWPGPRSKAKPGLPIEQRALGRAAGSLKWAESKTGLSRFLHLNYIPGRISASPDHLHVQAAKPWLCVDFATHPLNTCTNSCITHPPYPTPHQQTSPQAGWRLASRSCREAGNACEK
jgi:hypothetical protein